MRVLITRPEEDARPLVAELRARGIEATLAPLLEIVFVDGPEIDLTGVQALLVTSANGVRAFARRSAARDLRVMAVGDATARAARAAGFGRVHSAAGDVNDLAGDVRRLLDRRGGALLHPAAGTVAGDLAGDLADAGFEYRRQVMYRAETAVDLPAAARDGLERRLFGGVLIYSPRTAKTFAGLVEAAGLSETLTEVRAFCLSRNVADAVAGLPWADVLTAVKPEQEALLALLDRT